MADSVVHVEMEDVLNSVRRLVSEDSPNESADTVQDDVCFVLTPAHRVGTRDPGFRHRAGVGFAPMPPSVDSETPEPPAELEQLLSDVSRQTEAEDPARAAKSTDEEPPANFTAAEYQSMAEAWKNELATNAGTDAPAFPKRAEPETAGKISLEDRIADLEEAVMRSHDDWEPDGSEPSRKPEIHRHLYEVVNNTETATGDEQVKADDTENVQKAPVAANEVTPEVEEPEVVSPVFSHVVPDTKSTLVLVEPVADPRADKPEPKPETELEPETVSESAQKESETPVKFPDSGGDVVTEDDVFLDVEALRAMIGDLVREELRGKMGERITHNVRQMVRQEIERALLSHDD